MAVTNIQWLAIGLQRLIWELSSPCMDFDLAEYAEEDPVAVMIDDGEGGWLPITDGSAALSSAISANRELTEAWNAACKMPYSEIIEELMATLLIVGERLNSAGISKITFSPVPERFSFRGWLMLLQKKEEVWDRKVVDEIREVFAFAREYIPALRMLRAKVLMLQFRPGVGNPREEVTQFPVEKIGYLGLAVNETTGIVRREGHRTPAFFAPNPPNYTQSQLPGRPEKPEQRPSNGKTVIPARLTPAAICGW